MDDKDSTQNPSTQDASLRALNNDTTPSVNHQAGYDQAPRVDGLDQNMAEPATAQQSNVSGVAIPPKKSKKGLIITLIATAVLLFGLGLAYVYWYQNPNKVVADAFLHALDSKTVTYTGTVTSAGASKVVVTMNGGATADGSTINAKLDYEVDGKKYSLDGNGIIDKKNDVYFKVQNIDSLVNNYRRSIPANSQGLFDQVIDKVNDKWVKISSEDIKSFSPEIIKTQECLTQSMNDLQNDAAVKNQLVDTYKKYPFIAIDKTLGAKNGSLGYTLKTDAEVEKNFEKEFKNTSFYKSLVKCDSSFANEDEDQLKEYTDTFDENVTTELWVDRWSHQITKLAVKQDDEGQTINVAIEPKFNQSVTIVAPKDVTTIQQLQQDIQALFQSAASEGTTPQTDTMMQS